MSIKLENSEKPSFSFFLHENLLPMRIDLALAVGDENDVTFFEA